MKRTILVVFSFLFSIFSVVATNLSGLVVDREKKPIPYVTAALLTPINKTIIDAVNSDANGKYVFSDVLVGDYLVELSMVGYETVTIAVTIEAGNAAQTLGTTILRTNVRELNQVEISGQASQMRFDIDKKVFSVDQNLAAAGASASEVLENIPSVEVDNEGNISLRNNSSVEIWINGKPSGLTEDNRAQILQQMPAGSIESIEIITNPSAKYQPEGTAGVINLVLKKERQAGYYGSITAGGDYQLHGKPAANIGANFNYNSSLIDAYVNVGLRQRNFASTSLVDRYTFNPADRDDTLSWLGQEAANQRSSLGFFGRAGIDFHIDAKNTIGASAMFNLNGNNNFSNNEFNTLRYNTNARSSYLQNSNANGARNSFNVSLDYLHEFDKLGSELRLSTSYGKSGMDNETLNAQDVLSGFASSYRQLQGNGSNNSTLEAKADFIKKFENQTKLEVGAAFNGQDRNSLSKIWQGAEQNTDSLRDYNSFIYNEWITALYATYGAKFGNFSIQGGLRGEYASIRVSTTSNEALPMTTNNKSYFQLYPTLFLSYALPKDNELQLNYTRRVNRPRGRQLSAYRDVTDSTSISYGNPNLNPEFSNSMELNHIKSWGQKHALSTSLYYRYTTDIIQRVTFASPTMPGVMETTSENIARSQSAGIELVSKNRVTTWLNLTTTLNGYYNDMEPIYYNNVLLQERNRSFSLSTRMMGNFLLPYNITAQLSGYYNTPRVIAQGRTKSSYGMDLGLRKSFLKRALNVSVSVRDVLVSRAWRSTTWSDTFWQDSNMLINGPQFSLSLTYNFGNMNRDRDRERNGENGQGGSDEQGFFGGEQ